ncbi:MAG: amidohydrolase family protein, partial [Clostridia bacterium]|nr:amidohydrolase family protein [Clostridia bacterium]
MFDILFCDLPVITMQEGAPLLEHAYVGVRGKKIAYVGTACPEEPALCKVDGRHKLMMPGLVNTHAHTATCIMRGYADDYPLQAWLYEKVFPVEGRLDERAILAGAALGYAESIAAGITSTTDMYFKMPATLELALKAGIRTNFCNALMSFDPDGYRFENDRGTQETIEALPALHGAGDGRILVDMGVHGLQIVTSLFGAAESVACTAINSTPERRVRSGCYNDKPIKTDKMPDQYLITLKFPGNRMALVDSGFSQKASRAPQLEIFGDEGT